MEKVPANFNLVGLVVSALLLMSITIVPVHGGMQATMSDEEKAAVEYKMMLEEATMAEKIRFETANKKMEMMRMLQPANTHHHHAPLQEAESKTDEGLLQCAQAGQYCNNFFGPRCCTAFYSCVLPTSIVGGVCAN